MKKKMVEDVLLPDIIWDLDGKNIAEAINFLKKIKLPKNCKEAWLDFNDFGNDTPALMVKCEREETEAEQIKRIRLEKKEKAQQKKQKIQQEKNEREMFERLKKKYEK